MPHLRAGFIIVTSKENISADNMPDLTTKKPHCLALLVMISLLAGCSESPSEHFRKNQSGVSPDYGVFYDGNLNDHVVTIHGFWDDGTVCEEIANTLEEMSDEGQPYSCRKLN